MAGFISLLTSALTASLQRRIDALHQTTWCKGVPNGEASTLLAEGVTRVACGLRVHQHDWIEVEQELHHWVYSTCKTLTDLATLLQLVSPSIQLFMHGNTFV